MRGAVNDTLQAIRASRMSGSAIAALVVGIIALTACPLVGPVSIVLFFSV